jgi:beta-N-acetylhexosaminidase
VLGEKDDAKLTYENAKVIAETLKSLGFNLNFAPVVDVNTNPENPVIAGKERSYSSNPYKVAEHSEQVIKAHKDLDILTALKHFPGHGSSSSDSHLGFVDVSETWNEKELIPYKELINTGKVEIVMTAHVFNKKLDEKYPATLSKKSLSKLRKDFAYDGIIISDDLQMNAIAKHYSIEEAIPLMVNAGVDIFCIGNNLEIDENIVPKVIDIVMEKIFSGEISEEQIETSYNKIISLKKKYKIIR